MTFVENFQPIPSSCLFPSTFTAFLLCFSQLLSLFMHSVIAWAVQKGFLTPKVARPDVYRAANSILRMVVEGRLVLCMRPPGFFQNQD